MSGEKSLRGLVDMKMMDNPVLSNKFQKCTSLIPKFYYFKEK